jgi:flagellar biosynthesis/type III secretory pathway protein FliH
MSPLRLEVFEIVADGAAARTGPVDASELDEARLAAFENGYKAGWDDAVAAQEDAGAQMRDDIARALQALSFTYHEARAHVLHALSPLIAEIAARLLPEIAHASLPHLVTEALGPYAEIAAEAPIRLMLNPEARGRVEALLGPTPGVPLTIVEDPELSPGQVWLALGDTETRVDIDAALATIRTALDDFFDLSGKDFPNG